MIRLSLRSSQSCHSWSSFIFTKSNENNPVILWSGRVFQQLMNLVTFAPCLEARLDPTLRKKSHGENASVSDCLTRNSPKKKLLTCCSFCTYLEKTPCAIFFVKCPLNLPIPKTCQRGFKSYTPHSYDSWDWPTNWNKTLQMMNPMAECTKIIKTRKRTGSKTWLIVVSQLTFWSFLVKDSPTFQTRWPLMYLLWFVPLHFSSYDSVDEIPLWMV